MLNGAESPIEVAPVDSMKFYISIGRPPCCDSVPAGASQLNPCPLGGRHRIPESPSVMSRRITRTPVHLLPAKTIHLPVEEIKVILRAADDLIARGGRTLLSKILKGSKGKRLLELGLDRSPVYGVFHGLRNEEILAKIDWLITNYYLQYEYDGRLPLLVYTPEGWEIERETYAEELFRGFLRMIDVGQTEYDMTYLKNRDRGMIFLLLDKVEMRGDKRFVDLLRSWEKVEFKKVRQRIRAVIRAIESKVPPADKVRTA